jgi:hypothetical protein
MTFATYLSRSGEARRLHDRTLGQQLLGTDDRLERRQNLAVQIFAAVVVLQNLERLFGRRVRHDELHHEAIELGFGERVGSLELHGILRGDHREEGRERDRLAAERHRALLHHLQQRRLGLGRRAIDLVGQQDGREDRALAQVEGLRGELEHLGTEDVGRHQIRGELDALEIDAADAGQRPGEQGLADARNSFQQDVAPRVECGEQLPQQGVVPDEDRLDGTAETVDASLQIAELQGLPSVPIAARR